MLFLPRSYVVKITKLLGRRISNDPSLWYFSSFIQSMGYNLNQRWKKPGVGWSPTIYIEIFFREGRFFPREGGLGPKKFAVYTYRPYFEKTITPLPNVRLCEARRADTLTMPVGGPADPRKIF